MKKIRDKKTGAIKYISSSEDIEKKVIHNRLNNLEKEIKLIKKQLNELNNIGGDDK